MTHTTTIRRFLAATLLCAGTGAQAQVTYGGYDLGPDYGAMIQQQLAQQQRANAQMQQMEQAVVQRAMNDPQCAARYREFLAQGGQMPYAQFAYRYAATAGFTPDGIARYRQSESANQQREQQAWNGYRSAQDQRGQAQADYAAGYARNQNEAGQVLQGNSAWVDPRSGETRELSYLGANTAVDENGQRYHRADDGQYYVQGADGLWYAMTPGR